MSNSYGTVITEAGAKMFATCALEGKKLHIAQAAAGDGNGAYYEPTASQTSLVNEKWRGDIAAAQINEKEANMLDVKIVIPADVGGFIVREIGLFDEGGVLIAVCNTPDTEKADLTSAAASKLTLIMHIIIADASVAEFTVTPSLDTVSREELDKAIENHNHPANQIDWVDEDGQPYEKDLTAKRITLETEEAQAYTFTEPENWSIMTDLQKSLHKAADLVKYYYTKLKGLFVHTKGLDGKSHYASYDGMAAKFIDENGNITSEYSSDGARVGGDIKFLYKGSFNLSVGDIVDDINEMQKDLLVGTAISENFDADSITEPGRRYIEKTATALTCSNLPKVTDGKPVAGYFEVFNLGDSGYVLQKFTPYNNAGIFTRWYNQYSGGWGSWMRYSATSVGTYEN